MVILLELGVVFHFVIKIKFMFKNILIITFVLSVMMVFLPVVEVEAFTQATSIQNPIGATSFSALVSSIIDWVQTIGVLIAVLMIIYAGFLFMTAGGVEDKITTARKTLTWSLIGLAILIMGSNFIALIENILT